MKIFNRHIYVVNKTKRRVSFDFFVPKRKERDFSKSDVVSVMKMIIFRLRNFHFSAKVDLMTTSEIFDFVNVNALQIYQRLFYDGFVIIDAQTLTFREVEFKTRNISNGEISVDLNPEEIVFFDETYLSTGESSAKILRPYLDFLDTVNNSDCNLIENYGAMGILSPENSTTAEGVFGKEEKEELQNDYQREYGTKFGKWSIIISKRAIKFTPIRLPIAELQLMEKRKAALSSLMQFLNIPKELHALFESSKYANRNEAELDMYTNAVSAFARVLLDIAELIYKERSRYVDYLPANEFWFDIVGVSALNEAQLKEKEKAREELKFWREMKTEMPERTDEIDRRIENLLDSM